MSSNRNESLRRLRRTLARVEELETRLALSGMQPTALDQEMLERLNDIRANPAAYGKSINLDLSTVAPSQALAFNPLLDQAATGHSVEMSANNYFGHNSSTGQDPGARIAATGFSANSWGESIAAGYSTVESALQGLIVDSGVPDLGHRKQLLAMTPTFQHLDQVGIGVVLNGTGSYHDYYTLDSAASADTRPFLTGVVFKDANGNGKYDAGEGVGGVTISVAGVGSVQTWDSGGYSLQVNPGTYTVTASGGGLSTPVTTIVTVGASNFRLNFIPGQALPGGILSPSAPSGGTTAPVSSTPPAPKPTPAPPAPKPTPRPAPTPPQNRGHSGKSALQSYQDLLHQSLNLAGSGSWLGQFNPAVQFTTYASGSPWTAQGSGTSAAYQSLFGQLNSLMSAPKSSPASTPGQSWVVQFNEGVSNQKHTLTASQSFYTLETPFALTTWSLGASQLMSY